MFCFMAVGDLNYVHWMAFREASFTLACDHGVQHNHWWLGCGRVTKACVIGINLKYHSGNAPAIEAYTIEPCSTVLRRSCVRIA